MTTHEMLNTAEALRSSFAAVTGSAFYSGWWWTRPAPDCLWRVAEITIGDDGKAWIQEMGDEEPDILRDLPWWDWSGPIVPPNAEMRSARTTQKQEHADG